MAKREGTLTPQPYARLLTMLSEQLIKNNTIALTELAKNSYDADANWIQIRIGNMENFGKKKLKENQEPFLEIEDDGEGMTLKIIEKYWMNPASPHKYLEREKGKNKTKKGRIIQGEKGIGRYAVFKIGKKVEIYTRRKIQENQDCDEVYLVTDLSRYSEELLFEKSSYEKEKEKYGVFLFDMDTIDIEPLKFEQIKSEYRIENNEKMMRIIPGEITIEGKKESRKNHGTLIRITELNDTWNESEVKKIRKTLSALQSPFRKVDFSVSILFEGETISVFEKYDLKDVLEEADLAIEGTVDENGICEYELNKGGKTEKGKMDLVNNLKEEFIKENRLHFFRESNRKLERIHEPECGPFCFKFYVYDIEKNLDKDLTSFLKNHRIYIYRDDIRVYPYGDKGNDWLNLDIYRGWVKAGYYLSNDQTIGYVNISWEKNKKLRDKTNREGLIEQGTAYEDLRLLTLSILNFLNTEFKKIKEKPKAKDRKSRPSGLSLQGEIVEKHIDALDRHFKELDDPKGKKLLSAFAANYEKEKKILNNQIELVEDLAGVGIAVDAASHDIIMVMERMHDKIKEIQKISLAEDIDKERLRDKADALFGQFMFVHGLLKGIQPIFRSARRRSKELRISDIVKAVKNYYSNPIDKLRISVNIDEINTPLVIKSSEGMLLQLFINLMDNAVYWLRISDNPHPQVKVLIDGNKGSVIFADNGKGIKKEDVEYIFEPFFSTKGLEGRGLGLYIARQLTDRYEYDLYYIENKEEKILPGANFKIDFIEQEN